MSVRITEYQNSTKRVAIFSAHFRKLSATDKYADDIHGAHREANRLADLEIAAGITAEEGSDPLRATGNSSETVLATISQSTEPDAAEAAFSWDTVIAETTARLTGGAPPASAVASDFWDEAFGKKAAAAASTTISETSTSEFRWDAVMDQHRAERQHHRR